MLDGLDRALLRALHADARASYRRLAAQVGTTPPTAIARIRRMEELGILLGFRPVLAPPPGTVFECISQGTPPGDVLERVEYADGTRWTCITQDGEALAAWSQRNGVQVHVVASTTAMTPAAASASGAVCHQCRGPLPGRAVERRIAGRRHVFCCVTCRDRMIERAQRLRR